MAVVQAPTITLDLSYQEEYRKKVALDYALQFHTPGSVFDQALTRAKTIYKYLYGKEPS